MLTGKQIDNRKIRGDNCKPVQFWKEQVFHNYVHAQVSRRLRAAAREVDPQGVTYPFSIWAAGQTVTEVARVWNRAMYLLGYTEGNDESAPLG